MKRLILSFAAIAITASVFAQVPEAFQYQAILRDSDGHLMVEKTVELKIDLVQSEIDGAVIYSETHSKVTSAQGLVSLEIGKGTTSDDFTSIEWGTYSHFIKVWVDGVEMGTTQLLSVPYAIYAETADHANTFNILLDKGDTPCDASTKGAMRYNSTDNVVEFCNGSDWIVLSGGISVELAQLTTKPVSDITAFSASSGGNILSNGGAEIFEKGMCLNQSGDPGLSDVVYNNGSGSDDYVTSLEGLTANDIYYIKAYAKNTAGTAFGDEKSFTTLVNVSQTKNAEHISRSSFKSGGNLDSGGSGTISEKGLVYGLNEHPTKADNFAVSPSKHDDFEVLVEGIGDETYHYRSYAVNESGINYGPEKTYRNHYVTENTISVMPSSVQFSKVALESYPDTPGSSMDNGKANTQELVAEHGTNAEAAYLCDTLTANGYTDWFLPSINELNHVYLNKNIIGIGDFDAYCWSSTAIHNHSGWSLNFSDGQMLSQYRTTLNRVICIRRKD